MDNHNSATTSPLPTPQEPHQIDGTPTLADFPPVTWQDLDNIFKSLPPKTSAGKDNISNKILKFCQHEIMNPLLDIINSSLSQATVPEEINTPVAANLQTKQISSCILITKEKLFKK